MPEWLPVIVIAVVVIVFLLAIYKVARVDQALIITGGRRPKVYISGGGFVIPIFRKYSYFDLCVRTVESKGDEIKTSTGVPVAVDWTAQIRPNATDVAKLTVAATSFLERSPDQVVRDVKLTLDGSVREVVASMKPEQVLREKEEFSRLVKESVAEEMNNLGFMLVSLNIQEVTDLNGYFENLAAEDREGMRRGAENITAEANQAIRERKATTNQAASEAELKSDLAIAEKTRDNAVRKAAFKAETDKAQADADIAGALRTAERQKELATNEGQVTVEQQVQANLAALKEKEVIKTQAEALKQKVEIDASAQAEKQKIDADGEAEAIKMRAAAQAEQTVRTGQAEADIIKARGTAEADIIKAKGEAEATAIKAKGLAEADAQKALAEALDANEQVNLKVTLAEIQRDTEIQVATNVATVMAKIGENAQFIDLGGGNGSGASGSNTADLLTRVLGNFPELYKKLNVKNEAINGEPFNASINELVSAIINPLGVLNKDTKEVKEVIVGEDVLPGNDSPGGGAGAAAQTAAGGAAGAEAGSAAQKATTGSAAGGTATSSVGGRAGAEATETAATESAKKPAATKSKPAKEAEDKDAEAGAPGRPRKWK
jgi:flotillin